MIKREKERRKEEKAGAGGRGGGKGIKSRVKRGEKREEVELQVSKIQGRSFPRYCPVDKEGTDFKKKKKKNRRTRVACSCWIFSANFSRFLEASRCVLERRRAIPLAYPLLFARSTPSRIDAFRSGSRSQLHRPFTPRITSPSFLLSISSCLIRTSIDPPLTSNAAKIIPTWTVHQKCWRYWRNIRV